MLEDYITVEEFDPMYLFSYNTKDEEGKDAFVKFETNKTVQFHPFGFDESKTPICLEVVQVDGKYGVKSTPSLGKEKEYLTDPVFDDEIILYGSNPGNTYFIALYGEYYTLHDKYGFTLMQGTEMSPIYAPDGIEVAAFTGKYEDKGYFLYVCPEKYELIHEGDVFKGDWRMRPNLDSRVWGCSSIENKGNGEFLCTKPDGSTETVIIKQLKR